jgi:hypothetical protein
VCRRETLRCARRARLAAVSCRPGVLATALDVGGQEEVISALQGEEDLMPELMNSVWQMDHPRLDEVLEVIGGHHPAKPVAKAARKALMKHRNR